MKAGFSLLALSYDSIGEGFEALQKASSQDVIEMIPSASGSTLLISGEAAALEKLREQLPAPSSARLVKSVSEQVAKSWLGLENPPLKSVLVVFESSSLGDVFEAATRLEKSGYVPFDLRLLRGAKPMGYVLATGDGGPVPQTADLHGQLTMIGHPSEALKSFFEVQASNH